MKQGEMFSDLALEQQHDNMIKALNMKKQTAIEWFIEKTIESGHLWVTDTPSDMTELGKLIEQAKQMEKEQIIESYRDGRSDQQSERQSKFYNRTAEQYYQEIFKKD